MARTIGRKRPGDSPYGDYQTLCSVCGTAYLRSRLRRDGHLLLCPSEGSGREKLELTRLNAASAAQRRPRPVHDGGGYDPAIPVEEA